MARAPAVWTTLEGAAEVERQQWLAARAVDRLAAVEIIRRAGEALSGGVPRRLERVFELVDAPWGPVRDRGRPRRRGPRAPAHPGASASWREFTKPNKILFIGRPPLRIDVLTSISGVTFRAAWSSRLVVESALGALPLIGLAQLKLNKAASGRTKDLLDLALLAELEPPRATRAAGRSRSTRPRAAARPSRTPGAVARPKPPRRKPPR